MAAGLRIWDENGNLIVDLTTRLGRVLGHIDISSPGSITPAGTDTGTLWACATALNISPGVMPTVTVTATKISWVWMNVPYLPNKPARLFYGVY